MSCETECPEVFVALNSNEIAEEFRKDSKISYSRDCLLLLAEVNFTNELPSGFDWSFLSDLDDAWKSDPSERRGSCKLSSIDSNSTGCKVNNFLCKSTSEHQKLPGLESPSTGKISGESSRDLSEIWDSCKLSSKDSKATGCQVNRFLGKSAPEPQKLPGLESPFIGRILCESSRNLSEKWGSCKLSSIDSKSTDHGKFHSNQSHCSRQTPESITVLRSLQNPEHDGILGSWSASKLPSAGSEVPILKLPGTDSCLLSRCKEPYRPPSFYKAMNHSKILNHGTSSNERSGCAECPRKGRAMEGDWRKDTSVALEEKSAMPAVTSNRNPPPTSPAVSASVEPPCSVGEASEKCRTEESPDHYPPIQDTVVQQLPSDSQMIKMDSEVAIRVEKLHGQVLEGGRFSALINLDEAEDIDAYFLEETLASNNSSRDGQRVNEANMGFKILGNKELRNHAAFSAKSKEIKIEDSLQVKATRKTTCSSSAVDVSISSMSSVEPSCRAASKELHKANAQLTIGPDHSDLEIWQFPHCTKKYDVTVDGGDSYRSKSRFIHWFPDNDKSDCNILSGADKDEKKVWGASTGKSMKENHLGQGKPREASTYAHKATFSKKTKTDVSGFLNSHRVVRNRPSPDAINDDSWSVQEPKLYNIVDEADSSLELNLPDEDSLITIDDIYIFEQEEPSPPEFSIRDGRRVSQFPGSSKLTGPESGQQNLSLPDPWFHESQMNYRNLLVHPSDSLAHANAPPTFHDPWKIHHNEYSPFAVVPPPLERVLLKLHNYKPFVDNFPSPRRPQPDDYCPDLDQILSAEPSNYHQFLQTPCCNQEPNVLRSLPLSYQTNLKPTMDVEKRGLLAEERNKYIMYLQLQRKLAQMNIEAAEKRAYCKANRFW